MVGTNQTTKKPKTAKKAKTTPIRKRSNGQRLLSGDQNPKERPDIVQVLKDEFAVREDIDSRVKAHQKSLSENSPLPFDKIIDLKSGNPQAFGQQPITYLHQVLALCDYIALLENSGTRGYFSADAIAKARKIVSCIPDGAIGAYSHSQGLEVCREEVAKGIANRDGHPACVNDILLTDGASPAVHMIMQLLIRSEKDGVMVPVPQYPLYSTAVAMNGGSLEPYYLTESSDDWGLDISELEKKLEKARSHGKVVRALVVINPGNPTGQVLEEEDQKKIVRFCKKENIILLADEVYQENVYNPGKQFHSFKEVSRNMGSSGEGFSLISFHSASKGCYGECGRRGGYMEVTGLPEELKEELYKLASVNLCANISGQIAMGIIMNPPRKGDEAYDRYAKEHDGIRSSLAIRAKLLSEGMNKLEGVTCHEIAGAMYAFPRLQLPVAALQDADEDGVPPDVFYARRLLDATGIVVYPGSGFGQVRGTYHIKCTILPQESQLIEVIEKFSKFHQEFMDGYRR